MACAVFATAFFGEAGFAFAAVFGAAFATAFVSEVASEGDFDIIGISSCAVLGGLPEALFLVFAVFFGDGVRGFADRAIG